MKQSHVRYDKTYKYIIAIIYAVPDPAGKGAFNFSFIY